MGLPLEYQQIKDVISSATLMIAATQDFSKDASAEPMEFQALDRQVIYAINDEDTGPCRCYARYQATSMVAAHLSMLLDSWPSRETALVGDAYKALWAYLDAQMFTLVDIHVGEITESPYQLQRYVRQASASLLKNCGYSLFTEPPKPRDCKYPIYTPKSPSPAAT